jgi:hypothetical protein
MNRSISPNAILQAPLPVWAVHQYVAVSERLSPMLRSRLKPQALAFANRIRLPGVRPVALQLLALNEVKLAFADATEDQHLVILFLAIMQTLQGGPAASGSGFGPNSAGEMDQLKLQELADQRAKALEVLENVMQTVRDVDKTILDDLKD